MHRRFVPTVLRYEHQSYLSKAFLILVETVRYSSKRFNDLPLTIYLDPLNPFILLR
ncbi:hypothetical protein ALC53_02149 [Atta colombica]|uniref:Uncharacterized protein n=1 Tax=Atta colombica TaxID=520822 RepID=A0A195BS29_9HYME|nr:hypothetical protein ALC53_02149 [Atta colombica]